MEMAVTWYLRYGKKLEWSVIYQNLTEKDAEEGFYNVYITHEKNY